jgi:hypothetical protein
MATPNDVGGLLHTPLSGCRCITLLFELQRVEQRHFAHAQRSAAQSVSVLPWLHTHMHRARKRKHGGNQSWGAYTGNAAQRGPRQDMSPQKALFPSFLHLRRRVFPRPRPLKLRGLARRKFVGGGMQTGFFDYSSLACKKCCAA